MQLKYFLLTLALEGIALSVAGTDKKPNIIIILADDLGWQETGIYGQTKIKTPNIDHLAEQGMRFTQAYSGSAVCAPSRCVLMTGKHPGHADIRSNGSGPLKAETITVAEILQKSGYTSGIFGKWGLGLQDTDGHPLVQGFDHFIGYLNQSHAHSYYPATLDFDNTTITLDNNPPVPGHKTLPEGADPNDPKSYDSFKGTDYSPDRINSDLLGWIRTNKDKSFFAYYATILPHVALHVPDEDLKPYLAQNWKETPFNRGGKSKKDHYGYTPHIAPRAAYAAMITRLDMYVGKIMALLKELNLEDETILIFTSDNGTTHLKKEVDYEFFESVGPLRGLKAELYEGGIRVPLIVRWPGHIAENTISEKVVGFEDFVSTLADVTESKTPSDTDGISFLPTLLGKKQPERPFLYREFRNCYIARIGDWKGVTRNNKPLELYNLKDDISEENDISKLHPEKIQQINKLINEQKAPLVKKNK